MHLAAFVLAEPGDRIAIEDPCYALARAAFEAYGLRVAAVRVDARGLDVERLPHDAKLAFVTPTHQFPLGGLLPVARRIALLAWAKRSNAYILEDDYDSEFTSKTRPLPALQSLDRDERILYIGSFSKTLAPAVRLGYLIVPPHLAARLPRRAREHEPRGLAASASHGRLLHHPRPLRAPYSANERALRAALRHPYRDVARTSSSCFLYWPNLDRPSRRRHRRPWICGHAVDLRKRPRSLRRPLGAVHRAARLFGYPAGLRQRRRFGDRASRQTRRRAPWFPSVSRLLHHSQDVPVCVFYGSGQSTAADVLDLLPGRGAGIEQPLKAFADVVDGEEGRWARRLFAPLRSQPNLDGPEAKSDVICRVGVRFDAEKHDEKRFRAGEIGNGVDEYEPPSVLFH